MTTRKLQVLLGLAILALVSSLGTMLAGRAFAQHKDPTAIRVATMPRLSELWRLTLDYPGATWVPLWDVPGDHRWNLEFVVPEGGRLPVWTDIPEADPYDSVGGEDYYRVQVFTSDGYLLKRERDGHWRYIRFPRELTTGHPLATNKAPQNGVVLEPGRYAIQVSFSGQVAGLDWVVEDPAAAIRALDLHVTALCGYWAEP
jgi:hypothetical protein